MMISSFSSNTSEVLDEDKEILKTLNHYLLICYIILGSDLLTCSFITLIDCIYYLNSFVFKLIFNSIVMIGMVTCVSILLFLKKKKLCLIAGFLYLILGSIWWLYKVVYICYLVFGAKVKSYFKTEYESHGWTFISFVIYLLLIFLRLGCCYIIIKKLSKIVGLFESYFIEKDHAAFLEKIGDKMKASKGSKSNNNDDVCEIQFGDDNPEEYNENQL